MRKDHILTSEEKLFKQQRLEENRRLRLESIEKSSRVNQIKTKSI